MKFSILRNSVVSKNQLLWQQIESSPKSKGKNCNDYHIFKSTPFTVETCIKEPRFFLGSLNRFLNKWLLF